LIARTPKIARIIGALSIAAALSWCIAAAATIPTVIDGRRTLVAVEPLLQTLQLTYVIRGTELNVDGRRYPQPLVERDGMDMADAADLARFLHLSLTKKNHVLVFSSAQSPDATESSPPSPADLDALRQELLATLNDHRIALGREPLHFDPIAQQAAQYQSEDMSRSAVMRHEDASGRTPMQRFAAMGGRADWYAENVGWYGLDVTGKSELWSAVSKLDAQMMAEQPPNNGHRETILSQQYEAVGIGVTVGPHGLYLAEDFVGQ
jgi:uncharacterized protein YkwD